MADDKTTPAPASKPAGSAPAAAGSAPAAGGGAAAGNNPYTQTYVVQSGDTLSKIAQKYYGDASLYNTIFEANRDILKDPNKIQPGQKLRIP